MYNKNDCLLYLSEIILTLILVKTAQRSTNAPFIVTFKSAEHVKIPLGPWSSFRIWWVIKKHRLPVDSQLFKWWAGYSIKGSSWWFWYTVLIVLKLQVQEIKRYTILFAGCQTSLVSKNSGFKLVKVIFIHLKHLILTLISDKGSNKLIADAFLVWFC